MESIPPEIWTKILGNLLGYTDSLNASQTCPFWRDILYSRRQYWLFSEILPLIFQHLSKEEILACRLVCRQWSHGVEYFLENNAFHRPHVDLVNQKTEYQLSSLKTIETMLTNKSLKYHGGSETKSGKQKMLSAASSYARNPILGRSVYLSDNPTSPDDPIRTVNVEFLRTFGKHVWFLCLDVYQRAHESSVELLKRLVQILSLVPNLKQFHFRRSVQRNLGTDDEIETTKEYIKYVNYVYWSMTEEQRASLPKMLETLILCNSFQPSKLNLILFLLLANENLQTIKAMGIASFPYLENAPNLVDVDRIGDSRLDLKKLATLRWPLQRLQISLRRTSQIPSLFKLLNHFQATICDFWLQVMSCSLRNGDMSAFANPDALKHCQKLKGVTIEAWYPFPLTFLYGLAHCLEYLHLSVSTYLLDTWTDIDDATLNLVRYMKLCRKIRDNQLRMYESNVWTRFPKLRLLVVSYIGDHRVGASPMQEYRRDTYDRLNGKE